MKIIHKQYQKQVSFLIILSLLTSLFAQQPRPDKTKQKEIREPSVFNTDVPKHFFDIVLGRPTDHSVTVNVLFYESTEGCVEYNTLNEKPLRTKKIRFTAGEPVGILLDNLKPNQKYYYRLILNTPDRTTSSYHFQTQRSKDAGFAFTITADSHLDQNCDTKNYTTTLLNALSDSTDFHIDLGDTFMTDKYGKEYQNALNQYIAQRYYFGLLCAYTPLYLVIGNHDGENGQKINASADNVSVWSNNIRKKYFSNPVPSNFYSGNDENDPYAGKLQNYYAWEWGNAQFIVLDPFWFTTRAGNDSPWERTLGKKQYDWLKLTLEKSKARFKFIFIHNLVGGIDQKGKARGGSEVAGWYEWGGNNPDGSNEFKQHRPDWDMPIHQLLVKNKVTAVFHGHDHLFAKQEKDGIIYQCISQPGSKRTRISDQAQEYGYLTGAEFLNPGYLKVDVLKDNVFFKFVNTDTEDITKNKTIIYQYELNKK